MGVTDMSEYASLFVPEGQLTNNASTAVFAYQPYADWGPRVIQHNSDVMQLPSGAVVMSAGGIVWQRGKEWYMAGCADPFPMDAITLPAKVLFEGSHGASCVNFLDNPLDSRHDK